MKKFLAVSYVTKPVFYLHSFSKEIHSLKLQNLNLFYVHDAAVLIYLD